MSKQERLDKILSHLGYGSRRDIKHMAKRGVIKVDGIVVKDSSAKVNPYISEIMVGNSVIEYREYIYIMLNKPSEVVSSTDDPRSKTVIDLLEAKYRAFDPFPIGRLDKDTEGLLILSNDGQLAHNLLSPKKHVEKTYYVEVEGKVEEKYIDIFKEGIVIDDGYKTMAAKLEILDIGPTSRVHLTIEEGKFHQVKRMFKALSMEVTYLKRISMGELKLDDSLKLGEYRELTEEEVGILRDRV